MKELIRHIYRFKLHFVFIVIFLDSNPESCVIARTGNNYEIPKETVMIPMRDGIKLSTDIFFPDGLNEKKPVILIRTSINKAGMGYFPYYFASQGYVVAVQDVRGRFSSEGNWEPFVNEGEDGYDAIEWLAKQEWSNGKVGMMGGSYMAHIQFLAAIQNPPHLTTIIPHNLPADAFKNSPYENGIFLLAPELWWMNIMESGLDVNNPVALRESQKVKDDSNLFHLPVKDIDLLITRKNISYFKSWVEHNSNDHYWTRASYQNMLINVKIPVLLQTGWYDTHSIGSTLAWEELSKSGNKDSKLVIGPWNHANTLTPYPSVNKVGKEAAVDFLSLYKNWFDFWLKDIDNKANIDPKVNLYIMNDFRWVSSENYPLIQTNYKKLYFDSKAGANSLRGDGRLIWDSSVDNKQYDSYIYDPGDPTPAFIYRNSQGRTKSDAITSVRNDILVYESNKLDSAITIAGPVSVRLFASSDCVDTDWFVYLYAINEENKYLPVTHGCIRARFRNNLSRAIPLRKNKVYEYDINLWHTGIKLGKDWKIRVEISSADFPQYSRNLNTGGNNETETGYKSATQKIFHSGKYQSYVLLPIINN
jgi:putative CocE/NonD family hydrolase